MKMETVTIPRDDLMSLLLMAGDTAPESCFYPMRAQRPDLFKIYREVFLPDAAKLAADTTTDQRCIENALDALGYITD